MDKELKDLCIKAKKDMESGKYEEAYRSITDAMKDYPDSGIPHNLLGIWEEHKRNHISAMKHFRAAWALEPTLLSARWNLDVYGGENKRAKCAYMEEDVPQEQDKTTYKVVYDEKGVGRLEIFTVFQGIAGFKKKGC